MQQKTYSGLLFAVIITLATLIIVAAIALQTTGTSVSAVSPAQKMTASAGQSMLHESDTQSPSSGDGMPMQEHQEHDGRTAVRTNPYPHPALSAERLEAEIRSSLVNIQCFAGTEEVRPITGSGVLIDPRGIILTNAHVAQYVLLSQSPDVNLKCHVYYGSPAQALLDAEVLYISPTWVQKNAANITKERMIGTGEFDYALLHVTGSVSGTPLMSQLPSLPIDTRQATDSLGDTIVVGSYPAEFIDTSRQNPYVLTSKAAIKELLTFRDGTADVLSIGGVPGAQSGSSGGAIVNRWGHLIGIITTTSEGATTLERDLRAISLFYIDKDLRREIGIGLQELLQGDVSLRTTSFNTQLAPTLINALLTELEKNRKN